ncbi:general stress protein [Salipaludibacillus sp. CUR1]|uniref:Heat induced stress protein YflT n=1 Tax=Salipaludibacillus aurantiacus TaxID=1601833 RepID=A0A1H9V2Q8_9BACI|nr:MULTISPECIES: general stress protein [Salipaludibacillus]MCE7793938.1 general stress protein [Salipaludibacillus sp. CUR1]SES15593.1 Heat induced stress protein YflT [Salipaludibacillus aurantiacus]
MSSPKFKLFHNDETLSESVGKLRKDGVRDDDIYVISHDNDHERRTRKSTDANKVGVSEVGAGTALKNVFRNKGDKLRSKMKEIGIDADKAEDLEEELDKGKTLLVVTNQDKVEF